MTLIACNRPLVYISVALLISDEEVKEDMPKCRTAANATSDSATVIHSESVSFIYPWVHLGLVTVLQKLK